MKHLFGMMLILFLALPSRAQVVGKVFPAMEAQTAEDKVVKLPRDVQGKYTLLGLAYSKKSEDELNTWFEPVFSKFIQKTTGLMAGLGYDVHVFFVPRLTGNYAAATRHAEENKVQ